MNDQRFVTPEEIAAFETRVMSVGHGVLSDSEWRRLINTLEQYRRDASLREAQRDVLHARLVEALNLVHELTGEGGRP